ncbi:dihydrodipicolinate synthetase [Lichtheimia hyalospora FSU 10163]|nr:dihydrodipicolinate synthetase [Lichtheimia hyalospora FSU 10163]
MAQRFIPYSVAMVTPFTKSGTLDLASVPAVVKYYLDQNIPGLLVSGTTGEQHCMTIAERKQLYNAVATTAAGKIQLYAGVAAFKTDDAKELAQAARDAGFNGIMLGFPPYRIPSQHEAEQYVAQVAATVKEVPIFLYNNPRRNGFNVEPETFVRIAKSVDNVFGQKEAGHPENVNKMKTALNNDVAKYSFLSGDDAGFVDAYINKGYTNITSIAGNVYPSQFDNIVELLLKNENDQAKQVMESIAPGIALLSKAGMIQSIKYILRKKGVPVGYCPPPIMDIDDETKQALDQTFF